MSLINVFDAARDGTYQDFARFYNGNPNQFDKGLRLSLLQLAVLGKKKEEDKLKIVKFLLSEGADINFTDPRYKRNTLHFFYFDALCPDPEDMLQMTKLLVENGIDINCKDKYHAIPLKYAISLVKLSTEEMKPVYKYLLEQGSDYTSKDVFDKSCLDYMKEYSWRNGVLEIVEEVERK